MYLQKVSKNLDKYPNWSAKIIGDEKREKINLSHKNADILGFLNHKKVINIFKTSIAVACSRWEEPFGRTSLEASANGCAVIITNKEDCQKQLLTLKFKKLNKKNLENTLNYLIKNDEEFVFKLFL